MSYDNVLAESIKAFGKSHEANFETIEIPASEMDHLFRETLALYNLLVEVCKDMGILRGRELSRMVVGHQKALEAEKDPVARLLLANAFIRQLIARIKKAYPAMSRVNQGRVRQAITKIQLRAECLIDHIKTLAEGKEKVALSSPQARQFLAGREGKPVSRRDCIRALRRAEKICPALECGQPCILAS